MSPSQPLPAKENALYKKLIKSYDYKLYKNCLKYAKQILSNPKCSEHGETLSMKGLTLNCLGRKEEAYDHIRRGLRNDLSSHVCWHAYGLLQRSDRKYDEAIKCYRNALKWDKENIQILRDLSLLQIHLRDLEGYRETRYILFILRPTQRASWICFAMAYHLLKDYQFASKILEDFRKCSNAQTKLTHNDTNNNQNDKSNKESTNLTHPPKPTFDYEKSEQLLYQIMIMKEGGYYQEALDHLNRYSSKICDKLAVHEFKADLLILLGKRKKAIKAVRENLIARNIENRSYYERLEKALQLHSDTDVNENDNEKDLDEVNENVTNLSINEKSDFEQNNLAKNFDRHQIYIEYQQKYPKSQMPFRLPLNFVNNEIEFQKIVDEYLRKSIRKGQPALFRNLKTLYVSAFVGNDQYKLNINEETAFKIRIIEHLVLGYRRNLSKFGSFDTEKETWGSEDPTCVLFVNYYLAQHFDYLRDYSKALFYVNEAIDYTPTLIELYVIKAKIYKHAGNIEEAIQFMIEAQSLDSADRYLNSKCAKYILRGNRVQEAEEMCSKFTREGISAGDNLNEMQCMWFQTEAALAHQRLQQYGESLKKCIEIDRHFSEITEDQFDFHSYCLRKMTLRSYIGLLRLEDILKSHPFYFRAAKIAIEVYLHLYDKPLNEILELDEKTNLTPSELKKLKLKQKKEKKAAAANAANKSSNKSSSKETNHQQNASNDNSNSNVNSTGELTLEKLIPSKLERPENPLTEAVYFLKPLQQLASDNIETHLIAFEIYYRKNKILLMLQSLKRAAKIENNHPMLQKQLVLFYNSFQLKKSELSEPVIKVIDLAMKQIIGQLYEYNLNTIELNEKLYEKNKDSLIHRLECLKAIAILNKSGDINSDENKIIEEKMKTLLINLCNDLDKLKYLSMQACASLLQLAREGEYGQLDEKFIEKFRSRCNDLFPLSSHFMPIKEKPLLVEHITSVNENHIENMNVNNILTNHCGGLTVCPEE